MSYDRYSQEMSVMYKMSSITWDIIEFLWGQLELDDIFFGWLISVNLGDIFEIC